MKTWRSRFHVAWAHCDAAGIVFYPHFYMWFDQATERLFQANGFGYADLERELGASGMPLVETGARYRNPCRLGDEVEMASWVDEWGGRSFLVRHRIDRVGAGPAVEGFERRVLVVPDADSPKGIRAIALPDSLKARFTDRIGGGPA